MCVVLIDRDAIQINQSCSQSQSFDNITLFSFSIKNMNHASTGVLHIDKVLLNSVDGCSYVKIVLPHLHMVTLLHR